MAGFEGRVIDGALFAEVQGKRGRAAGVITLPKVQYPMLVTFGDIADPASVKQVSPTDLAASFGSGVRLKSVTLEVTDEAVTAGVLEGVLSWIIEAEFIVPPDKQPKLLEDTTAKHRLMPSDFVDWRTLRSKKEGN